MKPAILIMLSLLAIFLIAPYVEGCLWPAGRLQIGKPIEVDGVSTQEFVKNLVTHEDRAYWERVQADLEKQKKDHPIMNNQNNVAVAMIHLGQVKDAISVLERLERQKPGQYITAANLGTAYELNGENQKALEWIKEGINRNTNSHLGTEWLHVKILEAKLAIEKDPEWLKRHSVLEMELGIDEAAEQPVKLATDYLGQQKSLTDTEKALVYQLHERLEFIKPPDPVVADLLFDLSKVFAFTRTAEHSKAIYNLSLDYGANPSDIIKNRREAKTPVKLSDNTNHYILYLILGAIVLMGIVSLFIIKKQKLI